MLRVPGQPPYHPQHPWPLISFTGVSARKLALFEEAADVLNQSLRLKALSAQVLRSHKTTIPKMKPKPLKAFIKKHFPFDGLKKAARRYLHALRDKMNAKQPWREKGLSPLHYFATRAGDELRELFELIHKTKLPRGKAIPNAYARKFPLLRQAQDSILAKSPQKTKKTLATYAGKRKLSKKLRQELKRASKLALKTIRKKLGIKRRQQLKTLLKFLTFKLNSRTKLTTEQSKPLEKAYLAKRLKKQ